MLQILWLETINHLAILRTWPCLGWWKHDPFGRWSDLQGITRSRLESPGRLFIASRAVRCRGLATGLRSLSHGYCFWGCLEHFFFEAFLGDNNNNNDSNSNNILVKRIACTKNNGYYAYFLYNAKKAQPKRLGLRHGCHPTVAQEANVFGPEAQDSRHGSFH